MYSAYRFLLLQIKKAWLVFFSIIFIVTVPVPVFFRMYIYYQDIIIKTLTEYGDSEIVLQYIILFMLTQAGHEFFWRVRDAIKIRLSTQARLNSVTEAVKIVMRNKYQFFEEANISAATANTRQIAENVERILVASTKIFSWGAYLVAILFALHMREPKAFWILLMTTAAYSVVAFFLFKLAADCAAQASGAKDKLLAQLYNTFINMQIVFLYKTFEMEVDKAVEKADTVRKKELVFEQTLFIIWTFQALMFLWLTWKLIRLVRHDSASIVFIITVTSNFIAKMWSIAQDSGEVVVEYGRLREGLRQLYNVVPEGEGSVLGDGKEHILLEGLEFFTGKNHLYFPKKILITKNELVTFTGSSGAGKTTLAELILGLIKPTAGKIYNGLMGNVAYIPQAPVIFNDTIRNNLTYGTNKEISDSKIKDILKDDMFNFLFSKGINEAVENGDFSGGERQKLHLARVLVKNHIQKLSLTVLDEPTSAMDADAKAAAFKLITNLPGAKIIITHETENLEGARAIVIY